MNYGVFEALSQISREKNISKEYLIEALKAGLLSACKKSYGNVDNIEIDIDEKTGVLNIFALKEVIEDVENIHNQISLHKARKQNPKVKIGDIIKIQLSFNKDLGRNAIQTAKQILIQRVREAERSNIYNAYKERIGEILTGNVQRIDRGDIIVVIANTEAVLPRKEQMPRERYQQGDIVRAYLLDVLEVTKGPQLILSRTHPNFLRALFEFEVPEIAEGIVEVIAVAREPGWRSKIAVYSSEEKIDPVGACVGMRGTRVQAIVQELNGERIDIIHWSPDPEPFVSRSLSPAKVLRCITEDEERKILVVVEDGQLSLAIGKAGQNARLAAKLTGWHIDLMSYSDYVEEMQETDEAGDSENEMYDEDLEDVLKLTPRTIQILLSAGIETIGDLNDSSIEDLLQISGIGNKRAEKLKETVNEYIISKKSEMEGD